MSTSANYIFAHDQKMTFVSLCVYQNLKITVRIKGYAQVQSFPSYLLKHSVVCILYKRPLDSYACPDQSRRNKTKIKISLNNYSNKDKNITQ